MGQGTPRLTSSQLNRLGERLRAGDQPSYHDLELLAAYQSQLEPLFMETRRLVEQAYEDCFPGAAFEATGRAKQYRSVVAKLQRDKIRLSKIQDLMGLRVVTGRVADQSLLLARVCVDSGWKVIDRRGNPSHGYRAVHLIRQNETGAVEVQIRTLLQHQWAEMSEFLARFDPTIKYGGGDADTRRTLDTLSRHLAEIEELELDIDPQEVSNVERLSALHRQAVEFMDFVISEMQKEEL